MSELFSSMYISAAGMTAQRSRMDVVAENIANVESTRTEEGGPYRRRQVVFQTVSQSRNFSDVFASSIDDAGTKSVKVSSVSFDQRPFREVYDPGHPDADEMGIVKKPNVNSVEEMIDLNSASRSFEANVTVMDASKRMFIKSLELLR
ncbi:MAG: flagellar basal body rod protein FlgC [Mariprofundaceae bacterium]